MKEKIEQFRSSLWGELIEVYCYLLLFCGLIAFCQWSGGNIGEWMLPSNEDSALHPDEPVGELIVVALCIMVFIVFAVIGVLFIRWRKRRFEEMLASAEVTEEEGTICTIDCRDQYNCPSRPPLVYTATHGAFDYIKLNCSIQLQDQASTKYARRHPEMLKSWWNCSFRCEEFPHHLLELTSQQQQTAGTQVLLRVYRHHRTGRVLKIDALRFV